MKRRRFSDQAFTFVELAVAAAVVVVAGALFFSAARAIGYLGAKNAAVNLTHAQARTAIHRAVTEIRDSVSIPQLTDAAGTSLGTSTGPAAGVSYQQVVAGPYVVWSNASAGQKNIVISARASDPPLAAGMRLIVPAWFIESDITAVTAASGTPSTRTVTLAQNVPTTITCTNGAPNYVAYFTQRSSLVVVGSELRYFAKKGAASYAVISQNVTSPTPFTIPNNDNRFVQADFATQDPRILGRNFKSMNLQMTLTMAYRFRLTNYQ